MANAGTAHLSTAAASAGDPGGWIDETDPRPDDQTDAPKRDKGRHAAETGIFPAITAEALAAEALAAAAALDAPPAGMPDPFTDPASEQPAGTTATAVAAGHAASTGDAVTATTSSGDVLAASASSGDAPAARAAGVRGPDEVTGGQPLVGPADEGPPAWDGAAEIPFAVDVPGDDSPTVADYVPALAIEATDDDDDHYRGARRRLSGRRRYPVGALLVIAVIVVIMGVVAVQLFSGGSRTPTAVGDTPAATRAAPNLAVPPLDSPSAVGSPSAVPSATRSHAVVTTKAVAPPASHPPSPVAPSSAPPPVPPSVSLSLVRTANRCATAVRGAVVLEGCNSGSSAQLFTMPGDGTVRWQGHLGVFCLDLQGGGTGNRTAVQFAQCNGGGTQRWVFGGNSTLRNGQAGRCLDDGGNTGDNAPLIIWDCSGNSNQLWRLG